MENDGKHKLKLLLELMGQPNRLLEGSDLSYVQKVGAILESQVFRRKPADLHEDYHFWLEE